MRLVWGTVLVILTACLQVSWFGHIRPLGIMPSVMVITVVLISLWGTASFSLASAIGGGLLLDMASGSDFGLRMAFFVVISLAIIAGRQLGLQAESWLSAVALVAAATLLYNAAIIATLRTGLSTLIISRVGADILVTTLLALIVCGLQLIILAHRPVLQKLRREVWQ